MDPINYYEEQSKLFQVTLKTKSLKDGHTSPPPSSSSSSSAAAAAAKSLNGHSICSLGRLVCGTRKSLAQRKLCITAYAEKSSSRQLNLQVGSARHHFTYTGQEVNSFDSNTHTPTPTDIHKHTTNYNTSLDKCRTVHVHCNRNYTLA